MMDYETNEFRNGFGEVVSYTCTLTAGDKVYDGSGPTENAAVLDAMAKAATENDEARVELGILLGMRGGKKGGRPFA